MIFVRRTAAAVLFVAGFAAAAWIGVELAGRAGLDIRFPLGGQIAGGPFELIDHNGDSVTERDFRGRPMLVYFGYTYCPDVCPTHLADLMLARDLLGEAGATVKPVFITVDPDRDTVEQVRSYVAAFGPDLTGLTGSPAQIAAATKAFGVYYRKVDLDRPGGYIMDHSALGYLLGPDGDFLASLAPGLAPEVMAEKMRPYLHKDLRN